MTINPDPFLPDFPKEVSLEYRAQPSEELVTEWIEHIYPDWEEGQGPEHNWSIGQMLRVKC